MDILTDQAFFRSLHVLFGIAWIGLLYYFNFVQAEYVKIADPDAKADVFKKLAPNALWWFRWAALFTFLTGVILLHQIYVRIGTEIILGATMGTIMMLNVWGIIWRNQKIVLGMKEGDAAAAGAKAGLASRTNTLFSVPMLMYMVYSVHGGNVGMGSGMVPDDLGFMLQDRGELFSLDEDHFNVYEPGKRPFHTIIPAFITKDGAPFVSFGLMGGAMQPQGHAQIVVNLIDFEMNLQEAGDAPRIRHSGSSQPTGEMMTDGGRLNLESGIDYEVIRALMRRGHKVSFDLGSYGGYQAILFDAAQKVYYGASESRKDGQAIGY